MIPRHIALRFAVPFVCVLVAPVCSAAVSAAGDPTAVRAMSAAGAHELALAHIEASQPRDPRAPRWADWETLRCESLARLKRYELLLARADAPSGERAHVPRNCTFEAARAALARRDPETARKFAAALLWQANLSEQEAKQTRLVVVESFIAERRPEDAFVSMLRFQQDYQPLASEDAERFAQALLDLGRDTEALNWFERLGSQSPARLRLQLRAGTVAPRAVITQARSAYTKTPHPAYWQTIYEAAARDRNTAVQIEALERMLQTADATDQNAQAVAAQRLWEGYLAAAAEFGAREQLLTGDDGAWADRAARQLARDPFVSRALYAYLAQRAHSNDVRRNAQLQLAFALYSAGLDAAALRAMQRIGFDPNALDEQTRYLLGTIATKYKDNALALKLWHGLATPANVNAIEWQLMVARAALQAGETAASVTTVQRLLAGRTGVSPELAQRVLELAQEMLDLRAIEAAQSVYESLVPLANDRHARDALFGLGRVYELGGEFVGAAGYYLRSALLVQATAPDALAFQARLLAGLNLMRAGLSSDARAQFEWLLRNAKEPAMIEAAKRALSRV